MSSRSNLKKLRAVTHHGLRLERLPTNTTTRSHAVHRWFNFIAGFSPELVKACVDIDDYLPTHESRLLDPFSGCGTAPLAARLLGMSAVGYEPHPFFRIVSEAKANSPAYWDTLPRIIKAIVDGIADTSRICSIPSDSAALFLGKMFRAEDLKALYLAQESLRDDGLDANPLAVLALSRMLDHCCFAATDGIYKAPTSSKRALSPAEAANRVFSGLIEDEEWAKGGSNLVKIFEKSSEDMHEVGNGSVDLVITSPPYLNNFDYAEMTRMYLYFWGFATSWGEITDRVRSRLIVNTTTALRGHKELQETYRNTLPRNIRIVADKAVLALSMKRKERAGKKEYDFLVYPYLSQMQQVLREIFRTLKPGAPLHMMVSDAALYGIHLPAPQWLAEIMAECGFVDVNCELVRTRGHRWALKKREGAVEGLGEYYLFGRSA